MQWEAYTRCCGPPAVPHQTSNNDDSKTEAISNTEEKFVKKRLRVWRRQLQSGDNIREGHRRINGEEEQIDKRCEYTVKG